MRWVCESSRSRFVYHVDDTNVTLPSGGKCAGRGQTLWDTGYGSVAGQHVAGQPARRGRVDTPTPSRLSEEIKSAGDLDLR